MTERRAELREFLRSRRARVTPADVGLPDTGRRRTPGLRREELAMLAGVGVSWYTWLEQGRDIRVSDAVLDAIGAVLRLDAAERDHLFRLAGLVAPPRVERPAPLSPELLRLLDAWAPRPAYVRDRHWNFVAVNETARRVFGYGGADDNCLVALFTDARFRAVQRGWSANAAASAAAFRADAARYPGDGEFDAIAARLSAASPEFAALWARHDVVEYTAGVKEIEHPDAGLLVFEATVLPVPGRPGHHLVLHNARPGTGTAERLEALRSLVVAHPG
ncbi:helix-turn-helix transcriptional regulator [Cryptosporangium japonicum]|uniref:Helix-turn-helix transcriptional regulator n=1 Tax=Cryptosporangium japonicum TaxID=80872 RepID=A0ABN0UK13_9ACTN